ncbi:MAG: hypothetical protein KDA41_20795, partial [Planctomycetales bacterium]|nr:hypothetical protein [Planctomycetales bacterium]
RVELRFTRSDASDQPAESIVLFDGPPQPAPRAAADAEGELVEIDFRWDLRTLASLAPGTTLSWSVVAGDYLPQEDATPLRMITLITPDQLEDRLAQRQTFLLGQLAEAAEAQRQVRSQTTALQIHAETTEAFGPQEAVELQSAELNQRRVSRLLGQEQDGLLMQIDQVLEVMEQNRVDNPEMRARLAELRAAVEQLCRHPLPAVERDLLTSLKAAQAALRASRDGPLRDADLAGVRGPLDAAGATQDEVIAKLEQLLGRLSQFDNYRRFARQISQLRRDQQGVRDEAAGLVGRTLSQTVEQLSPQLKSELARLAQRQTELAHRLESEVVQMQRLSDDLATRDPLAAQSLQDAVALARGQTVSGKMQQAARQIESNRLGQSALQHETIDADLVELLDTLTGRREHQLDRKLEQLKDAAEQVKQLRSRAEELRRAADEADDLADENARKRELQRLAREREQQQEEIDRIARRLERLEANRAAEQLSQAAAHQAAAGRAAEENDPAARRRESDLAEEHLAEAEKELARQVQQAEQDLLDEQLARLEQRLEGMVEQQRNLLRETERLD